MAIAMIKTELRQKRIGLKNGTAAVFALTATLLAVPVSATGFNVADGGSRAGLVQWVIPEKPNEFIVAGCLAMIKIWKKTRKRIREKS